MDNQNQDPTVKLRAFITAGYQHGLSPNEISTQLRSAGWSDDQIQQAFKAAQGQVLPVTMGGAETPKRGRMKTGWLLFKESWRILRSDDVLFRFVIMSGLFSVLLFIVYAVVLFAGNTVFLSSHTTVTTTGTQKSYYLAPLGYIPTFIYYVLAFFVVNLYAAGLTLNVLDLFKGQRQPYGTYMAQARAKMGKLFVFAVVEATVGLILRVISERSKLLGRIVVAIIGVVWSLARLFVVPILVTNEEEGVFPAIKDSSKMLIETWGENLVGRVSMGGALTLIFLLIMLPVSFILLIVGSLLAGGWGAAGAGVIILLGFLAYIIVSSAASQVLNVALYYYAQNKQVPQAFDADLLNSAMVFKKKKQSS